MKALSPIAVLISALLLQGCVAAAVVGTAAVGTKAATDPRSVGTQVDDGTLEVRVNSALSKDEQIKKEARINVTAYQGKVLLAGQAPNMELASRAKQIAMGVEGTTEVFNEVRQGKPIGLGDASSDTWITTKVRSQLLGSDQVKSSNVKVTTENGEVFLLGLVTEREGKAAADIASRVSGVEEIAGHGVLAQVDGRRVAVGNRRLMERQGVSAAPCELPGTIVYVAVDGAYAGHIVISDLPKEDAKAAIADLKANGVKKTVMLTGDTEAAAKAVAAELGVDEYHAELLPADKVEWMERLLASSGGKTAFVGDGINDAPVLTRADIGIAMGALGSDAAIEAADIVLMDDKPSKIATAMRISRKTLRIAHQNIWFALIVKFAVMILGAFDLATMWEAVFADVGVAFIAILNATRCLKTEEFRS